MWPGTPSSLTAQPLRQALYGHYRRELYENVAGGVGIDVQYRFAPGPDSDRPVAVDLTEAETSAVVMLIDERWAADPA